MAMLRILWFMRGRVRFVGKRGPTWAAHPVKARPKDGTIVEAAHRRLLGAQRGGRPLPLSGENARCSRINSHLKTGCFWPRFRAEITRFSLHSTRTNYRL